MPQGLEPAGVRPAQCPGRVEGVGSGVLEGRGQLLKRWADRRDGSTLCSMGTAPPGVVLRGLCLWRGYYRLMAKGKEAHISISEKALLQLSSI